MPSTEQTAGVTMRMGDADDPITTVVVGDDRIDALRLVLTFDNPDHWPEFPEPLAAVVDDTLKLLSLIDLAMLEADANEIGPGYRTVQRMRLRLASASAHLDRFLAEPDEEDA